MRILIISTFFPPLNSIASLRPYSWAKYWSQAGHEVTVLTMAKYQDAKTALMLPTTGFEVLEVKPPRLLSFLKQDYQSSHVSKQANAEKSSSWLSQIKKPLFAFFDTLRHRTGIFNSCRMPDFSDLWIRPALKSLQGKDSWDLVVSTAGPYSVHIAAGLLKKAKRARKWIADYRDAWSDNCVYPGLFPFNAIERILERKLMNRADAITTISEPFAKIFSEKYNQTKVYVIENGFDPCDLEQLDAQSIFPKDGKFRIVHTGTIYLGKRDPTPLFQAIAKMRNDPQDSHFLNSLEVLFVGPNQANLAELIEHYKVAHWVKQVGFVSRETALRMQRDAEALLFLPWNDTSIDGVMTGKIFEYLFSGTEIWAIGGQGLEASQKLILDAKAGLVFSTIDEIIASLQNCLRNRHKRKSAIDSDFLRRYNRKFLAEKILTCVKQ